VSNIAGCVYLCSKFINLSW